MQISTPVTLSHLPYVPCVVQCCYARFCFFVELQAVRLKEKGVASEIVAVSCGPAKSEVMKDRFLSDVGNG